MATDLRHILYGKTIQASAPGRIDCGGGWDLKGLAITQEVIKPSTVNLALNLRTTVVLEPEEGGMVCVSGEKGKSHRQGWPLPFTGAYGLVYAIVSYFDVTGVRITITSDIPPQSGLGGSGVVAVALIAALSKACSLSDGRPLLSPHDAALLAHHIEDGLHISHTGLQDQLAAAYGGVNQWVWRYSDFDRPYARRVLLPPERLEELDGRILVAYSGAMHESKTVISQWLQSFREPDYRSSWHGINEAVHALAQALHDAKWQEAAEALRQETALWDKVCPHVWTPFTRELQKIADAVGCPARFTGAGGGGCVWALGTPDQIARLKPAWETVLYPRSGRLLAGVVTADGLTVSADGDPTVLNPK